jgi:hypothetical protein
MKISKTQLKQIIKEELSKVLVEGDLPRYNKLPDERKDLGRDIVQNYFNNVKDYQLKKNYSGTIAQIIHNAYGAAHPNKAIGQDISRMLTQKYPDERDPVGGAGHPHWTTISWGVREELKNLNDAIRDLPEEDKNDQEILNRLRDDWVGYATELGVELGQYGSKF